MILGIAHDDNQSAARLDLIALGNARDRVIGAFGMKIGMDFANEGAHVFFVKNDDRVNVLQRRQNLGALGGRHHGPPFTLQGAHGGIGVDRDNQFAAKFASGAQIAYMADMKQVEAAVGESDAFACAPPLGHTQAEFVARNNLPMG